MSYVYKNITNQPQLIAVVNESRTDVSHIPLSPGARIELNEPTLDMYMPHILARLNGDGQDITHMILRQAEEQKAALARTIAAKEAFAAQSAAPVAPVVEEVVPVVEVVEEVAPVVGKTKSKKV